MRYRIHEEANMWTELQAMPEGEATMSLDRWSIALDIEMIDRIGALPDHGQVDDDGIPIDTRTHQMP